MGQTEHVKAVFTAKDRGASRVTSKLTKTIVTLGAAAVTVGLVALGRKYVQGIMKAVKAAGIQEEAEAGLANAIELTGGSVDDILPKLKAQASALQDLTGVGDEVILKNQQMLIALGKLSGEGLQRATLAAINLGARIGNNATAFDLVSKAATGYTSTLSRYGIILDEAIPASEKFEAALSAIEGLASGAAAAALDTFNGRLNEFKGRVGDLREAIGGPFAEVIEVLLRDLLSPFVKNLGDAQNANDDLRDSIIGLGIKMLQFGRVTEFVGATILERWSLQMFVGSTVVKAFASAIPDAKKALEEFGATSDMSAGQLAKRWLEFNSIFDLALANLEKIRKQDADNKQDQSPLIPSADKVRVAAKEMLTLDAAVAAVAKSGREVVSFPDDLSKGIQVAGRDVESLGKTIDRIIRESGVDGAKDLGDALVDAAFGADVSFGDFFKRMLIDLAKSIFQAKILDKILSRNRTGAAAGGGGGPSTTDNLIQFGIATFGFLNKGGIVHAAHGMIAGGRDTVPAMLTPGEAVLPKELTEFLMDAATRGSQPIEIVLRTDVPSFVERVNDGVRDGSVRVLSSDMVRRRRTR